MKTKSKILLSKVSQAGSMMVEAMAMLALISLVTPTLYKKSAERTTELQDINTATHLRTIMKAVDSYVSANYQSLLEDQLRSEDAVLEIDLSTDAGQIAQGIHDYFPYGYQFDEIKNFGAPKVALKRQGMSITSFVGLPKKMDIGDMRAARIASMIGSNGGYVDADGNAQGVGGVWSLGSSELNSLNLSNTHGSIVVASSDAINSATSGALENEKYLQRTEVESTDQLWRNTMVTDLYMGGVTGVDDMHKILGVDQLILGSSDVGEYENHADLVLTNDNGYEGSAWMAGSLSALSDSFTISGTADNPILALGEGLTDGGNEGELIHASPDEIAFYDNNAGGVGLRLTPGTNATMETDYATTISNTLDVTGDTTVASGDTNTSFKAGPDGSYITADANRVALMDGNVEVARGDGGTETNIKTATTNISGDTTIGSIGADATRGGQVVTNPKLSVQGSAYIKNDLEVGETLYAKDFNTLELHAGGTDFTDKDARWLHATAAGVSVTNPENVNDPILQINSTESQMFGPSGSNSGHSTAVILGDTDAQLRGVDRAELYTEKTNGIVDIQNGALVLTGTAKGSENGNTAEITAGTTTINADATIINSNTTTVYDGIFRVARSNTADDTPSLANTFYVDPTGDGNVKIDSGELTIDSNPLFRVLPNRESSTPQAITEVDDESFRISTLNGAASGGSALSANQILYVDASDFSDQKGDIEHSASIYIRRGAISLEAPEDKGYSADDGVGYIEANRFVSNAHNGDNLVTPKFSGDRTSGNWGYYTPSEEVIDYDRYMVNPAYTSVMHDIKLTTRGGARLSDILPDFINKGIYVVNNSYKDTFANLDNIKVTKGDRLVVEGFTEISGTLSGADQWGSPFLGVVPAPQCPPGHARVITITPASFQMAQAGQLVVEDRAGNDGKDYAIDEYSEVNKAGFVEGIDNKTTITGAQFTPITIRDEAKNEHQLYYLGHAAEPKTTINGDLYSPQPLYFQQSTWLKAKVLPMGGSDGGICDPSASAYDGKIGGASGMCGEEFLGWSAIMGFLYPVAFYKDIINKIVGDSDIKLDNSHFLWNVFPVRTNTLEAYATVYCYFDRTNLYQSGNDPEHVDQYDQLNKFRGGRSKGATAESQYLKRLEDPALKYKDPW